MEVVTEKPMTKDVLEGYKRTEVGVIPEDWEVKYLGSLSSLIGDGIHSTPNYSESGDYFFINGNNLLNGKIKITEDTKKVETSEFRKYGKNLNDSTILLSINGTIGNLAYYQDEPVMLGKSAAYINLSSRVVKEYVFYQLQTNSVKNFFENNLTGTTIKNLGLGTIKNTPLPIPPTLEEQQAIADTLSDVDALITELDALIEKKQQVKKGAMQQLLTGKKRLPGFDSEWEEKKLGDLLKVMHGKSQKSVTSESGDYPILGTSGQIGKATSYLYDKPSVLIGRKGTIDRPQYMEEPFWTIDTLFYTHVNEKAIAKYLYYRFLLIDWTSYNEASGVPSLNSSTIENIEILFPKSIEEQKAIVEFLSDMDAEIEALQSKRSKYEKIKQGMMQQLLTGMTRLVENKEVESEGHNWQYDEAVILSVLVNRFGNPEYPLGRFRRTKLNYLTRRFLEKKVDRYLKKAAGPYSSDTRYKGPEGIALRKDYVKEWENEPYTGFIASDNVDEACTYFHDWYGNDVLDWIEEQFKFKDNDGLELITTVDKAIVELNKKEKGINLSNVKSVIESHPEWKEKLERDLFSDENIEDAIEECLALFG